MPAYNISRGWHGLDTDWMSEGACSPGNVPTSAFYLELGRSAEDKLRTLEARQLCLEKCEYRQTCLDYALDSGIEDGIWGGLDGDERADILRLARVSA